MSNMSGNSSWHFINQMRGTFYGRTEITPALVAMPQYEPSISISTSSAVPFGLSIYSQCMIVGWSVCVFPNATHDSGNFWNFNLKRLSDNGVVDLFDTWSLALTTGAWNRVSRTISPVILLTSYLGIYVEVQKNGAPGNVTVMGPCVELRG